MSANKLIKDVYRSRAPLRLGLAGGGTDVSPFSDNYGGLVLNATIDLFVQAIIEPLECRIELVASDLQQSEIFETRAWLDDTETLRLHKAVYNRVVKDFNGGKPLSFKLTTFSDAPAGSGLGASSTLTVCIIQAFSEWLGLGLGEYEVADLAYDVERNDLGFSGGKQDQYAAAFGGFNLIEFGPGLDRVLVNPLRVKEFTRLELEASTVLYYTGESRESARIIDDQIKNIESESGLTITNLNAMKNDSSLMKEAILRADLATYARALKNSWVLKKGVAKSISNDHLDKIYDDAMAAGALAGKLSGAGGGGFFNFFVPPQRRMELIRALDSKPGRTINFHFTNEGVQSWTSRI